MPTLVKLPNVFQVNGSIPSLPSGTATVRNADTDALVSIYNDRAGASLLSSVGVTTATRGQVVGWSAPGVTWKITITQQQGSQTVTYGPYYHEGNLGSASADVSVFNTRLTSVESSVGVHVSAYLPGAASHSAAAGSAITAAGVGGVVDFDAPLVLTTALTPLDGQTWRGRKGAAVIGASTALNALVTNGAAAISDLKFEDLWFNGLVVDDVTTTPRRSRTTTGTTFNSAIALTGDLNTTGTNPVITDVRVTGCRVSNCLGLPILLSGIRGAAVIEGSTFINTMDVGWTYNESAVCIGNTSRRSADNGFSLSRGNFRVTAVGNVIDLCAYYGVWVSGFIQTGGAIDKGPLDFAVTGNMITRAGRGGIQLNDAPKYGVVVGNTVDTVYRGASDEPSDIAGLGIMVGGFPSNLPAAPTDFADSILIADNTLRSCSRGGVLVRGANNIAIRDNLIIDPGTQFLSDGTTTIISSDTTQNFGVGTEQTATIGILSIRGNTFIDTRGTPYANSPYAVTGVTLADYSNNYVSGYRTAVPSHDNTNDSYTGTKIFSGNTKFTGGLTTGSNSATGVVAGPDLNGAAGSTRDLRFLTAGVARWTLRANNTAEGGSSAGSNFELISRDDAGAVLKTVMVITRSSGLITLGDPIDIAVGATTGTKIGTSSTQKLGFFGATPVVRPTATSADATDLATAITLVNNLKAKLISLGLIS